VSIQQCTRKECVSGHLQNRDADKLIHMETVRYNFISILKHILAVCVDVTDARQTFYNVNNLSNLLTRRV
jgi:hypothetical protein